MSDVKQTRPEATILSDEMTELVFEIIDNTPEVGLGLVEPLNGESIESFDMSVSNAYVTTETGREIKISDIRSTGLANAVVAVTDIEDIRAMVGDRDQIIIQHWVEK